MGSLVDLLADQKEYDDKSKNSGDEEFTGETEGAKFLIHPKPTKSHSRKPTQMECHKEKSRRTTLLQARKNLTERKPEMKKKQTQQELNASTKK